MNPQQLDPVSVTVIVLTGVIAIDPQLANVLGPYAVIFFGAMLGGLWALSKRPPHPTSPRAEGLVFLAVSVGMAVLLTVAVVMLLGRMFSIEPENSGWMLAPVSLAIARLGPTYFDGLLQRFAQRIERTAEGEGSK